MPVTLHGILPDNFLIHVLLLTKAMRILLADFVTNAELNIAEELLQLFWKYHEKYYGKYI